MEIHTASIGKIIIILNLLITTFVANPRVMVQFHTDRMRIDGENYEYHEQTKQMSQRETKYVDLSAYSHCR